jgi:hypothetical protein
VLVLGPNAHAGVGEELLSHMVTQVVEWGTDEGLTAINNTTHDEVTGTLLSILGDPTDGKLDQISSQITVAQNMIANLQVNLDNFEVNVQGQFQLVINNQNQTAFTAAMTPVIDSYISLNRLVIAYSNIVANCYSNGNPNAGLKSQLSVSDQLMLSDFVTGADNNNLSGAPDAALNALAEASDTLLSSTCVYAADTTLLQGQYPFLHQTYAGMYDLLNYMASLHRLIL